MGGCCYKSECLSFHPQEELAAGLQEEEELKRQEQDLHQRLAQFKEQEQKQEQEKREEQDLQQKLAQLKKDSDPA